MKTHDTIITGSRAAEYRQYPRRTLPLRTAIVYKNLPILGCHTRDISFSGAFIETPAAGPPLHARLRLIIDYEGSTQSLVLNARVVKSNGDGVAVQFQDVNSSTYGALYDLVFCWVPEVVE